MLKIILFPISLIGMAIAFILFAILLMLDKIHPQGRILASFYIMAHSHGQQADIRLVPAFELEEAVEVIDEVAALKVFAGDQGVVTYFDGAHYTVEFNKYECCTYAKIYPSNLRKVK